MDLNNPIFPKERGTGFQGSRLYRENKPEIPTGNDVNAEDKIGNGQHPRATSSSNYKQIIYDTVSVLLSQLLLFIVTVTDLGKTLYKSQFGDVGLAAIAPSEGASGERSQQPRRADRSLFVADIRSSVGPVVKAVEVDKTGSNSFRNGSLSVDLISVLCPDLNESESEESESDGQQYGTRIKLFRRRQPAETTVNEERFDKVLQLQQPRTPSPSLAFSVSTGSSDILVDSRILTTPSPATQIQSHAIHETPNVGESSYDAAVARYYLPHIPPKHKSLVDSLLSSFKPTENWLTDLKEKQELITKERISSTSLIKPLTADQLAKIQKVWSSSNLSIVVSSAFQIDITCRDLQTLCDGLWLNDNVIDFYLSLITSNKSSVFCWTTHFFTTLQSKGYSGVARWAKRKKLDVTQLELVLVPINIMGTHWALAVVDNKLKEFQYYDSLSSLGNLKALQTLKTYMIEEGKRLNSPVDFNLYKIVPLVDTPQQLNGYDCGVFTCTSAFFVSGRKPLNFSQKDMKLLRRKMAYEILTKELI